ncbi:MAG: carboxymuconolactone decarboxylase family protein [Actinomycetota bacterium]|nr:carboxymuconolactone decarboxylase family protein [Actinomycetota bacterium]
MSLAALKAAMPGYARDIKLNLDSTIGVSSLPEQRLWGTVVATAIASRHQRTRIELEEEAKAHLSPEALEAAKAAAAVMAMNNIYYRAKHLIADAGTTGYDDIPARLRMQVIGTHGGVDVADFEFWCLAVSAINGCGSCLAAHERTVREHDVSREQVHDAIRIASVVHAVAVTLESEEQPAA